MYPPVAETEDEAILSRNFFHAERLGTFIAAGWPEASLAKSLLFFCTPQNVRFVICLMKMEEWTLMRIVNLLVGTSWSGILCERTRSMCFLLVYCKRSPADLGSLVRCDIKHLLFVFNRSSH